MTLFTGLGFLIGIPLSTAVGRRPVIVVAAVITFLSTMWAGHIEDFIELLLCVCLQGLAAGSATGMVRNNISLQHKSSPNLP